MAKQTIIVLLTLPVLVYYDLYPNIAISLLLSNPYVISRAMCPRGNGAASAHHEYNVED